jgi:hypothetical protein
MRVMCWNDETGINTSRNRRHLWAACVVLNVALRMAPPQVAQRAALASGAVARLRPALGVNSGKREWEGGQHTLVDQNRTSAKRLRHF